jgi:hypothetical protein
MASYFDSFRDIYQRVTITNTGDVIVGGLVSITISQVTSSDRTLKMGEFCKNSVKIVYRGEAMPWQGSTVQVDSVLSGVATPMGTFFVDKVEFDGVKYTITGYDLPASMDEEYDVSNGLTDSVDIVNSIATKTGVVIADAPDQFAINSVPENTTNRQMLGYIYGASGMNLRVVPADGYVHAYWYTGAVQISRSAQYQNQLKKEMEKVTINSLRTGTQDNIIEMGSGFGIQYYNPYITPNQASAVYDKVHGIQYYVGTIKYRGNPAIMCGDSVSVELADGTWATMYVMSQEFKCDGGMNATITSYGNEQNTVVIRDNVNNKIERMYIGFQDALRIATESLKGQPNGYFSLLTDADGNYIGWRITDTPGEPTPQTHGWQWTNGGLMWSENGFDSATNIAITQKGYIVGERITAKSITFDKFASALADRFKFTKYIADQTNQWLTFDPNNGLIIGDTQDNEKSTVSQMKSDGFRILTADLSEELFSAIANGDTSEVTATNLVAKNYLVLDYDGYDGRFEPYSDVYDSNQIGFYFIDE